MNFNGVRTQTISQTKSVRQFQTKKGPTPQHMDPGCVSTYTYTFRVDLVFIVIALILTAAVACCQALTKPSNERLDHSCNCTGHLALDSDNQLLLLHSQRGEKNDSSQII